MSIELEQRPVDDPDSARLLAAYLAELRQRLGEFDESRSVSATAEEMAPPRGLFMVLYDGEEAVACGGLKRWSADTAELKRMVVVEGARRRGHGRRMLRGLEEAALGLGLPRLVLDTAIPLREANALYRAEGYRAVAPYNANPYAGAWFMKDTGADVTFAVPRHARLWPDAAPAPVPVDPAHDRYHLQRVYAWALRLAPEAGADPDLAGAAALVHDLATVPKESPDRVRSGDLAAEAALPCLLRAGYSAAEAGQVATSVARAPWSRGLRPEGGLDRVLQDADRLDAIGSAGIARSFVTAGGMAARGLPLRLWDPRDPLARGVRSPDERANALDHFAVKLLPLCQGMHLATARAEAQRRLQTMEAMLRELERELDGPV